MDIFRRRTEKGYFVLREAAQIFGYSSDYIGWLIRTGRIRGRKVYSGISWQTTREAILNHKKNRKKKEQLSSTSATSKRKFTSHFFKDKNAGFISLKEAAEISGYASDYIGWLIRIGRIKGRKVYTGISWQTTKQAIENYQKIRKIKSQEKISFDFSSYLKLFHLIPQSGNKVFGFSWRLSLTALIIFFLVSGFAPIKFLQSSLITAITGEEIKTVNLYTTVSYGEWQNSQNVQGLPEVLPTGEINSFSEVNSAVYKTGPQDLMTEKFQVDNVENKIFQSAKIRFSFAIGEKEPDVSLEQEETGSQQNNSSSEESTSFWKKIKNFFAVLGNKIVEIAKIFVFKIASVAKAEEEQLEQSFDNQEEPIVEEEQPEPQEESEAIEIKPQPSEEITTEITTSEEVATITATTTPEIATTTETLPNLDTKIIIWWSLGGENWQQLATISDYPLSNALNGGYFEYDASFLNNFDDVKNLKIKFEGVVGGETNVIAYLDSVWVKVTYIDIEQTTEEEQPQEEIAATTTEATTTVTSTETTSIEEILAEATSTATSTEETEAITTEEEIIEGEEELKGKKLPKIKIKEISLVIIDQEKKSFRSDEEPIFIIEEPNITLQELINSGEGELIEGEITQVNIPITTTSTTSITTTTTTTISATSTACSTSTSCGNQQEEKNTETEEEQGALEEMGVFFNEMGEFLKKGFAKIIAYIVPRAEAQSDNIKNKVKIKIFNPEGKESFLDPQITPRLVKGKDGFKIKLPKPGRDFKPGKWKIEVELETKEAIFIAEKDFTWGVLAINTNKSIYINNEEQGINDIAYIQMAALKDDGHTICDAKLELQITNPSHQTAVLSTDDGKIQYSGKCGPDNVTDVPDYFAYYRVGEVGIYQLKLINLDNGYEITDSFEVRESVPFDVERIGPTRIYPPVPYEINLYITANQDFSGEVIEHVPDSFDINFQFPISNFQTISNNQNSKQIIWQVNWKAGETYELSYQFDAPDISPHLYLLGPLEIGGFKEARQWQIAADEETEWISAEIATNVGGSWDSGWTTTTLALNDGSDAIDDDQGSPSVEGTLSDFNFNVPAGSTIDGIEVRIDGRETNVTCDFYVETSLSWDDGGIYTNATTTPTTVEFPVVDETYIQGGPNNDWGHGWTVDQINNSFKLKMLGYNAKANKPVEIDEVVVKIHYTLPPVPTLNQNYYRWRDDSAGINEDSDWLAATNTSVIIQKAITTRLRVEIANTSTEAIADNYVYQIEYAPKVGVSCGDDESFSAVPVDTTTEHFEMATSSKYDNATNTTTSLLPATGSWATGTAVADPSSTTTAFTLATSTYTEFEYAIQATANAIKGQSYCFRLTNNGATSTFTYDVYPEVKIAITVSGKVYIDEGSIASASGSIVHLVINGASTATTTASTTDGSYSFSNISIGAAGDAVTVYLDNSSEKGVTVTRASSTLDDITGLNIYQNRIITRHEDSGPITISDLAKYDSDDDGDILFTATSSTGTLTASSTSEFFVWPGMTLGNYGTGGVGGTTTLADLDIRGTFTATSTQFIYISGNWDATSTAVFNAASSTVVLYNTGNLGGTAPFTFYNLTFGNGTNGTTTAVTTATATISNILTIASNQTLDAGSKTWVLTGANTPFVKTGTFIPATSTIEYTVAADANVTAADYYNLKVSSSVSGSTSSGEFITCGDSVTFNYRGQQVTYGTVTSTNSECWMDKNLGASQIAENATDSLAYGDLFQWGRLDDGHQSRTSATTTATTSDDIPGHNMFIIIGIDPYDWHIPQEDSLWSSSTHTNNPCPAGWRVSTKTEWQTELNSWASTADRRKDAFNSPLKLTAAGYHSYGSGSLGSVGYDGSYWSSTVYNVTAYSLGFGIGYADLYNYLYRALGFSVRCLQD